MSRFIAAARVLGLFWLLPLQIVAIVIYRSGTFPAEDGYAPAEQALGAESVILCMPLVALAAAIAANKLDRSGFLDRPAGRPPIIATGTPLLGIFLPSAFIAIAAQVFAFRSVTEFTVSFGLLAIPVAWMGAFALLGWLIGAKFALKLAAPISVLIPYALVGFPPAFDPPWIQHMVGMSTLCCGVHEVLSWRTVVAALALAGGMSIALWIAITRRFARSMAATVIAGIVLPIGLAGASAAAASPLGYRATDLRDAELLTCQEFGVTVCYWPEHAFEVESASSEIAAVIESARANGLRVPEVMVELPENAVSWPSVPLHISEGDSPSMVQWKATWSIMPIPSFACQEKMAESDMGESVATYVAGGEVLAVWLAESVGNSLPTELASPDALALVDDLQRDPDDGAARLRDAQEMILDCRFDRAVL